jgi:hypothetical protein
MTGASRHAADLPVALTSGMTPAARGDYRGVRPRGLRTSLLAHWSRCSASPRSRGPPSPPGSSARAPGPRRARRAGRADRPGIRVVRGGASAARRLRRLPGVRFVEPNRRFRASSLAAPSDPLFGRQWALRSDAGARGLARHARRRRARGRARLGPRPLEPDLAATSGRTRRGSGQRVDDDGNGFIDDVHGADTVGWDGDPSDGPRARHGRGERHRGRGGQRVQASAAWLGTRA